MRSLLTTYCYIGIGAVAGAISRYQIGVWMTGSRAISAGFPWPTLLINVSGSFVLGVLMRYLADLPDNRALSALLATGFCGAYTTFSTFSYETVRMFMAGESSTALAYMGVSLVAAPTACFAGYLLTDNLM